MTRLRKIPDSDDAWDSGQLGRAVEHARPAAGGIETAVDASLGLQLISIRLQKSLIEDLKAIASLNGIGYQPLMRQILKRFADGEKKRMAREMTTERNRQADSRGRQ